MGANADIFLSERVFDKQKFKIKVVPAAKNDSKL